MAKRFFDTELDDKEWFMKLPCRLKCAVQYVFRKCDACGIWEPNYTLAATYIGEGGFSEQELLEIDNGEQFEKLPNGKIFVVGFCDFQYGELTETCKPHRPIIQKLQKICLYERVSKGYRKGINTLQEKDKEKEQEKEKDKDFGKSENLLPEKEPRRPKLQVETEKETELKSQYTELLTVVQDLPQVNEQKTKLAAFISDNKPRFIEPYCDIWNVTVKAYGISQVEVISDSRLRKFKTRIREPAFDFIKILSEIKSSHYLQGKTTDWKVDWDWIMENDTNYLKIIEGKYRNNTN